MPGTRRAYFGERKGWIETRVLTRSQLKVSPLRGPLILEDYDATTLVPPDVRVQLDEWRNIVIDLE